MVEVQRAIALSAVLIASCATSPETAVSPSEGSSAAASQPLSRRSAGPVPEGQLGGRVRPTAYRLALTIVPSLEMFEGTTEIDVKFVEPGGAFYMHGLDLTVRRAVVLAGEDTIEASYTQVDKTGVVKIEPARPLPAGAATLRFEYSAPFNRKLQGIYRVDDAGDSYAFSQFEAISARLAFPSFDEPRFKTPFDIRVTAEANHAVITTTPEVQRHTRADGMVVRRFATTEPLPTYLLAFAVGPLDVVEWEAIPPTALRDRPIPLRGVSARGKGDRLAFALRDTAQLVTTLEAYFGVAYPYRKLDLIAAPDYAFGAMENVGAIVYREERLLLDETSPLALRRAYLMTHSHELAHQWFGNLVTPKWWTDIWLNESFASWMGNRAVATARPKADYGRVTLNRALATMRADSLAAARRIREPVQRNIEIWSAFDGITYRKGGGILAMFERYLGDDAFRAGVRAHMRRFRHGVADANDFTESLAVGSEKPEVIPAFRSFIEQPGVPLLEVEAECNKDVSSLRVRQSRYAPLGSTIEPQARWGVPFCYATFDEKGRRRDDCQLVDQPETVLALESCPSTVLPNAGGSGYYHFLLDDDAMRAVMMRFHKLSPTEQLTTFNSVEAAFRAGKLSTEQLLDAARRAAKSTAWDVQLAPLGVLSVIADAHVDDPSYAAKYIVPMYRPLSKRVGIVQRRREPSDRTLIRDDLVSFMALKAADPKTRRALLPIARRHLDRKTTTAQKPVAGIALAVAAAEGGPAMLDRMIATLKEERDGFARSEIVYALGHVAPEQRGRVFELILSPDLRVNETIGLVRTLFKTPRHRRPMLDWTLANFAALSARLPSQFQGRILQSTESLCDEEALAMVGRFDELAKDLQGAKRALAQAKESIALCIALKGHVQSAIAAR